MLVSNKHQHESAIGIPMPLPPQPPSHHPPIPALQVIAVPMFCLSSLSHTANSHWLSILHMVKYVYMLLSPYIPPSPSSPTAMSINLFFMCLYCCSANRLISTIILDAIYMCSVQCHSVAQLCLTLCNPMNRSMPGLPCPSPTPRVYSNSCPSSQ